MTDNTQLLNIIKENKGLIVSIINKYQGYYEFDDLYQVSIIGIIKAYHNYNPNKETKFTTYAYKYILSEVLNFVNNSKPIKLSREYRRLYKKILEAKTILTQKLMKEPSNYEISLFLEIDESIIEEVTRYQENIKSLDEEVGSDNKTITLLDQIESKNGINLEAISLKDELNNLTKQELQLIKLRYFNDLTQQETASYLGTNQVQVSRNEQKVLKKLKKGLYEAA